MMADDFDIEGFDPDLPDEDHPDYDLLRDLDRQLLSLGLRAMHAPDDPKKRILPEYEHFWFFQRITPVLCLTREDVLLLNRKLPMPITELVWDDSRMPTHTTILPLSVRDTVVVLQLHASDDTALDLALIAGEAARIAHELCFHQTDTTPSPRMIRRLTALLAGHLFDQYLDKIDTLAFQKDGLVRHVEDAGGSSTASEDDDGSADNADG